MINTAYDAVSSYVGSYRLATPGEMLGNLNRISAVAVPVIALVASQQSVDALPGACIVCMLGCSALAGPAFTICSIPCIGICPWMPF